MTQIQLKPWSPYRAVQPFFAGRPGRTLWVAALWALIVHGVVLAWIAGSPRKSRATPLSVTNTAPVRSLRVQLERAQHVRQPPPRASASAGPSAGGPGARAPLDPSAGLSSPPLGSVNLASTLSRPSKPSKPSKRLRRGQARTRSSALPRSQAVDVPHLRPSHDEPKADPNNPSPQGTHAGQAALDFTSGTVITAGGGSTTGVPAVGTLTSAGTHGRSQRSGGSDAPGGLPSAVAPKLAGRPPPCEWPALAQPGDDTTVRARAMVDREGTVRAVRIFGSPGAPFAVAARRCMLQARFTPARDAAGRPVRDWSPTIRIQFTSESAALQD